jgi:hypothetical protein
MPSMGSNISHGAQKGIDVSSHGIRKLRLWDEWAVGTLLYVTNSYTIAQVYVWFVVGLRELDALIGLDGGAEPRPRYRSIMWFWQRGWDGGCVVPTSALTTMPPFLAGQVCTPPDLPPYLKKVYELKPIAGAPNNEELMGIHAVIRVASRVVDGALGPNGSIWTSDSTNLDLYSPRHGWPFAACSIIRAFI